MDTTQQSLSLGIMSSFKTDNVLINIILSTIIITLISSAATHFKNIWTKISELVTRYNPFCTNQIIISYKSRYSDRGHYVYNPEYVYNNYLIKAVLHEALPHFNQCKNIDVIMQPGNKQYGTVRKQMLARESVLYPLDNISVKYKGATITLGYRDIRKRSEKSNVIEKILTLHTRHSTQLLRDYVQHCYEKFVKKEFPDKNGLHCYIPYRTPGEKNRLIFMRFKLFNHKSFDQFYHPKKCEILKLLRNFEEKRGYFAMRGHQHKLGFLLYGPPGTGKTSFIKALANTTNRSIISIKLNLIKTPKELLNIMFDNMIPIGEARTCGVLTGNINIKVSHKKRIYVFEDIDVMTDIVQKRESEELKKYEKNKEEEDDEDETDDKMSKWYKRLLYRTNSLTLHDLLNVFDGILELHNVIIVMTTNHVEKIDPALIRHGRVNMQIHMSYMNRPEIRQMIEYYFPDQSFDLEQVRNGATPPATIESLCQRSNSAKEVVQLLIKLQTD